MTTPKTIAHEHKLGTLKITFARGAIANEKASLYMTVDFELANSGELYRSVYDDSEIRALCPVLSAVPDLVADALAEMPEITATDAMVTATFATQILTRTYSINLAIARVRISSESAEITELQRENIALRMRVNALEAAAVETRQQLTMLAKICLPHAIEVYHYPGPHFEACLALSGQDKAKALNEQISGLGICSIICNLESNTYELLIADGFDLNRGIHADNIHTLAQWLHQGLLETYHSKQLDRIRFILHHGLDPMTHIEHGQHKKFLSFFGFMLWQQKRSNNPLIKREVGEQYDSLIKLMISMGAK